MGPGIGKQMGSAYLVFLRFRIDLSSLSRKISDLDCLQECLNTEFNFLTEKAVKNNSQIIYVLAGKAVQLKDLSFNNISNLNVDYVLKLEMDRKQPSQWVQS